MKRSASLSILLIACLPLLAGATKTKEAKPEDTSKLKAETFAGLELRSIGPALMSGRIADFALDPRNPNVRYVAVGSGGVWKSKDAGTTWDPIFDGQGSYSIGCIALDPTYPDTVWVGTGENVGGRHVGFGDGIYRSRDGGQSWENLGLSDSQHIGSIVVDPRDSDVVLVASQGPLWSGGGDRGVFKTIDGGVTWTQVLGGGNYTGANEIIMDPKNPETLFASMHQRQRTVAALVDGGPETAIHKSTDGGETWRKLEKGLPEEDMGKIGLAVSPQNSDVVYATIELAHGDGGFYRSADGGESWEKQSDYLSSGTGPHYYQEIFADPHHFDWIYQADPRLHVSRDGGKTFVQVGEEFKHGDNHAVTFHPTDPNFLLVGSDGGVYESFNLGKTWRFAANLPITQFYKIAVDIDEPFYNIYGGTQDNSTQGGPSRTDNTSGIRNSDWFITLFADGHQPATDPSNADIVYSEWQQGNLVRYDRKTGEIVYIQPQPEPGDDPERWNWDSPILVSPHDPARLYFASQRLWRSDDRGDSWRAVSSDLSRGQERLQMKMMDRVWSYNAIWDVSAMSNFGNITSVSESPLVEGLLYVGTDDGLVRASENGGETWSQVSSLPGIRDHFFVNDIKADLHDADTVYVAVDQHKNGDFSPYLFKSTDRGATWKSIAGDLPERHLVWRLVQDHEKSDLLFLGTEFGVYFTVDSGKRWIQLTGNAPTIPFRDLAIQRRENDLVGASFGRSLYILDDYTPLRQVNETMLEQEAALFPVKDAWWYIPQRPLGRGSKATQGHGFFHAENPPFGAVFTYYLQDDLKTLKAERRDKEKEIQKESGDNPSPRWDVLREEALEEEPSIVLTVTDSQDRVVRRLTGPAGSGMHRVAWDLRYPPVDAVLGDSEGDEFFEPQGILAVPGNYSVAMAKRHRGELTAMGEKQSFEVKRLRTGTLDGSTPDQLFEFLSELAEAQRTVSGVDALMDATEARFEAILKALMLSTESGLDGEVRALRQRFYDLQMALYGNEEKQDLGEPTVPSIQARLGVAEIGNRMSTYGPTPNHRRSLEIAQQELQALRTDLKQLVEVDLPALETRLEAAGVPWTPGRGVPGGE